MRAVIQRVCSASVSINHQVHSSIKSGLLILLGIETGDGSQDLAWLISKIARLRLFADTQGEMNLTLREAQGEALIVSQFTLLASTQKGARPSFHRAARPEQAKLLYQEFIEKFQTTSSCKVKSGVFAADMQVELINDGPVTLILDSKLKE